MPDQIKETVKPPTDQERWQWVRDHQDEDIVVVCDNDDTFVMGDYDDGSRGVLFTFNEFIGYDAGIFNLLEAMGIKAESV